MRFCLFLTTLAYLLTACEEPSTPRGEDHEAPLAPQAVITASDTSKGDVLYAEEPELIFAKDAQAVLTRELYADDIVTVRYELSRMNQCERGGRGYLQHLTGFYQVDGQAVQSFDYTPSYTTSDRLQSTRIMIPAGSELAIWFHSVDTNGCEEWDSNAGQNYLIPITQEEAPVTDALSELVFMANGEVSQRNTLQSGAPVLVRYDLSRLGECASVQNGIPQWGVVGHMKSDLGEEQLFQVTEVKDGALSALDVTLEVPEGELLYLWFTSSNRYGCFEEDEGASFEIE